MEKERIYALYMRKIKKDDLTDEEINFMANMFNMVINSDDYVSTIKYLAGIHELSISDVELIVGTYFLRIASHVEKKQYMLFKEEQKKKNNAKSLGFATISVISSVLILLTTFGIYVAYIIYNLM